MKRITYSLGIMAAMLLVACQSIQTVKYEPVSSSVFFKRDSTVQSAIVEEASASYYSADALESFVQTELDSFNASNPDREISIASTELKDNKLKLILNYKDTQSLIDFAKLSEDESMSLSSVKLVKYKDRDDTVEIINDNGIKSDSNLIVLEGKVHGYTESKILYTYGEGLNKINDYEFETTAGRNIIIFE